jgi:deoxyribodipyrimidine photo-lyase
MNILWFRRDLRISDNKALSEAASAGSKVSPIFIFDTNILNKLKDKDDRRVYYIWQALGELKENLIKKGLNLQLFYGDPASIFERILKGQNIERIFTNEDYEPYAIKRDEKVQKLFDKYGARFFSYKDNVVFRGDEVLKSDGTPYKVYTPYMRAWMKHLRPNLIKKHKVNFKKLSFEELKHPEISSLSEIGFEKPKIPLSFGESRAKKDFKNFLKRIDAYDTNRDFFSKNGTSRMSVHIRFGCISIRELFRQTISINSTGSATWIKELIWREFYQMILFNFPEVAIMEFNANYRAIPWSKDKALFEAWKNGVTGVPIIDAAMRHFKKTGEMHNRLRMVVSSFLTKSLFLDWRLGEKYFAEKLIDFDLASNNGGWQWSASVGCDAQPYFRIFNPYRQSERFDPHAKFIRKTIPELNGFSDKQIHCPHKVSIENQKLVGCVIGKDYPKPIVNIKENHERAKEVFKTQKSFNS